MGMMKTLIDSDAGTGTDSYRDIGGDKYDEDSDSEYEQAVPVSIKQPNMVQVEMSIEEMAMKSAGLVLSVLFVGMLMGLLIGLLIGSYVWNRNGGNTLYNPVKFVSEEAGCDGL